MRDNVTNGEEPFAPELALTEADLSLLREIIGNSPEVYAYSFDDPLGDQDLQSGENNLPPEVVAELNSLGTQPGATAFIIVRTTTEVIVGFSGENPVDSNPARTNETEAPRNTQIVLYESTVACH
jgi:hypothetical protein